MSASSGNIPPSGGSPPPPSPRTQAAQAALAPDSTSAAQESAPAGDAKTRADNRRERADGNSLNRRIAEGRLISAPAKTSGAGNADSPATTRTEGKIIQSSRDGTTIIRTADGDIAARLDTRIPPGERVTVLRSPSKPDAVQVEYPARAAVESAESALPAPPPAVTTEDFPPVPLEPGAEIETVALPKILPDIDRIVSQTAQALAQKLDGFAKTATSEQIRALLEAAGGAVSAEQAEETIKTTVLPDTRLAADAKDAQIRQTSLPSSVAANLIDELQAKIALALQPGGGILASLKTQPAADTGNLSAESGINTTHTTPGSAQTSQSTIVTGLLAQLENFSGGSSGQDPGAQILPRALAAIENFATEALTEQKIRILSIAPAGTPSAVGGRAQGGGSTADIVIVKTVPEAAHLAKAALKNMENRDGIFTAQVVSGGGGAAPLVLDTGTQIFSLRTSASAPPGSTVTFQIVSPQVKPAYGTAGTGGATSSAQQALAALLPFMPLSSARSDWASLDLLYQTAQAESPSAQQALQAVTPSATQKMIPAVLFFLSALKAGALEAWLGEKVTDPLRQAGKKDLLEKLAGEFLRLSKPARNESGSAGAEWRSYTIPFLNEEHISPIHLHVQRDPQENDDEKSKTRDSSGRETRFVLNLSLSRLGRLQMDGVYDGRKKNLDLTLRTENRLTRDFQKDISDHYYKGIENVGVTGRISFRHGIEAPPAQAERKGGTQILA